MGIWEHPSPLFSSLKTTQEKIFFNLGCWVHIMWPDYSLFQPQSLHFPHPTPMLSPQDLRISHFQVTRNYATWCTGFVLIFYGWRIGEGGTASYTGPPPGDLSWCILTLWPYFKMVPVKFAPPQIFTFIQFSTKKEFVKQLSYHMFYTNWVKKKNFLKGTAFLIYQKIYFTFLKALIRIIP